jgi:D-sedoheptulose 7-phosphate isomerase
MEYIQNYLADAQAILEKVDADNMNRAIDVLFDAWKNHRQVFIMGNGGSASNATHLAADLVKTIQVGDEKGIRAIPLSDTIPLVSAIVNDLGWGELYTNQLKTMCQPGDVGIAFSVHGGSGSEKAGAWSQNLLKGMQYVKDMGGKTIGFSGFDGGPLAKLADVSIIVKANSTPHVEGLHSVLAHGIVFGLMEKIALDIKAKEKGLDLRQ